MSQLLGTFLDSAGDPITGKLRVTLSGSMIDATATPDAIHLPLESIFTITDGELDIELEESETKKVTYRFEFFRTDGDGNLIEPALLDFFALVPNVSPVQFALLAPTGMVNDVLDTGALRIAQLIASDPNLSANIGGPFPKGDFDINSTYRYRDMVRYLNRVYISKSISPITGILPTNGLYWMQIPVEPDGNLILGDDTPYSNAWNGSGKAASQAAVYDRVESVVTLVNQKANISTPTFTGVINANNTIRVNPVSTFIPGVFNPGLDIQSANASRSVVRLSNNIGLPRWEIFKSEEPETGSNAGSNLTINSFADDGSFIGFCLSINRATRAVNVVTPSSGDNSTRVATTAFVQTRLNSFAPLANPNFTGVPIAPTPPDPFDNSNRIATTKHVKDILAFYAPTFSPTFFGTPVFSGPNVEFNNNTLFKNTVTIRQISASNTAINIQSPASTTSAIAYSNDSGLRRWEIQKTLEAEAGSNTGSNLIINRFDDAGNYLNWVITIARNNGLTSFNGSQNLFYGTTVVENTSASTDNGNGAFQVKGGVGVIGNVNAGGNVTAVGTVYGNRLRANIGAAPASNGAGLAGEIILTTDFIYVCTSTNSWRRAALSTY